MAVGCDTFVRDARMPDLCHLCGHPRGSHRLMTIDLPFSPEDVRAGSVKTLEPTPSLRWRGKGLIEYRVLEQMFLETDGGGAVRQVWLPVPAAQ